MENNDWIAYVGPFLFPNGQAGSEEWKVLLLH